MYRVLRAYQRLNQNLRRSKITREAPPESNEWPSGRKAEAHQIAAIKDWYKNDCSGIFKHATGSGKTFTGLHIIRDHIRKGAVALILVPSKLLFFGWRAEIREEIPNAVLFLAGAGNSNWRTPRTLEAFTSKVSSNDRRIILATMQTASSQSFLNRLKHFEDILLVADEVHQLGSPQISNVMNKPFGERLGLSATPERFGDSEGTTRLIEYFDGIVGGTFTLKDAMKAGRLVPYRYSTEFVMLNETEREQWRNLTTQIRRAVASSPRDGGGNVIHSQTIQILQQKRARIAKKAHSKINVARRILKEHYIDGHYWLVYCEDQQQMADVVSVLRKDGLSPLIYHSSMTGDSGRTLKHYIDYGGIMVAIRCLDEGVDIPQISHAVILASSQNPRQFIQRRGRVLRTHPGKTQAYIWDILVLPIEDDREDQSFQDTLTRAEFVRAIEFAENAINQSDASKLRVRALELNIDPSQIYPATEEDQSADN